FGAGATPVFANVTGREYPAEAESARDLLAQQLSRPVDFVGVVQNLYDTGVRTFVEAGPRAVLTGLVRTTLEGRGCHPIAMDASGGAPASSGLTDLARALAQLAALGHAVDLSRWEGPPATKRKAKMVVPLVGANYLAPRRPEAPAQKVQSMEKPVTN